MIHVPLAWLVLAGVGSPAVLLAILGGASLLNHPLPERWVGRLAAAFMTIAFVALLVALVGLGLRARGTRLLSYGTWSGAEERGIPIEFLVDHVSLAFAVLT